MSRAAYRAGHRDGRLSLHLDGRMHHIGIGAEHAGEAGPHRVAVGVGPIDEEQSFDRVAAMEPLALVAGAMLGTTLKKRPRTEPTE